MHYKLIAIFSAVASLNVSAESTYIAICRDPSGKAFRHFSGPQDKATAAWSDEKIGGGVVTLVQGTDGAFDMLYVDVRKRPISTAQDGAKIIKLRSGPNELSLLAHYSGSTSEIYSFFREKDGKNRYTVMTSRIGPETFAPKSSVMVGDCEPIRFDLIRGQ